MSKEYVIEVDDIDLKLVESIYLEDFKTFFKIKQELIRCKDCKHYFQENKICTLYSDQLIATQRLSRLVGKNFCSYGEREEDE